MTEFQRVALILLAATGLAVVLAHFIPTHWLFP
jgi:hypothetical protein